LTSFIVFNFIASGDSMKQIGIMICLGLGLTGCYSIQSFAPSISPKASPSLHTVTTGGAAQQWVEQASKDPAYLISTQGIGAAKLGMTLGQLKQALGSTAQFTVKAPFMVDFDAIAVSQGGTLQYYILYPSGPAMADSTPITALLTDNPSYRTAAGIGPGTSLAQAEAVYGNATLNYNIANESREFIQFANPPSKWIYFRPTAIGQTFAGIYSTTDQEYHETKSFHPGTTIRLVGVSCPPQACPTQNR
jgi:hypothetical protein